MSKIIGFQKFRKRKKLQNSLRFLQVISVSIIIGIFAYTLIIMKRDNPVHLPSYIEFKVGIVPWK